MVTTIVLVRHASSETKPEKEPRIPGPDLKPRGKDQAKKTALFLKNVNFSEIYSSSMTRAIETAKIITDKEPKEIEGLSEFNKIVFEEQPEDTDKFNENIALALKAKDLFIDLLRKHKDSKVLIIAHGNVIRYLICFVLGLKPHKSPNFFIDNASITQLFFDREDLVSVRCINSTTHLFLEEKNNI